MSFILDTNRHGITRSVITLCPQSKSPLCVPWDSCHYQPGCSCYKPPGKSIHLTSINIDPVDHTSQDSLTLQSFICIGATSSHAGKFLPPSNSIKRFLTLAFLGSIVFHWHRLSTASLKLFHNHFRSLKYANPNPKPNPY